MLWKDQKLKYINAKKINYILLSYIIYKYYYAFTCNTVMYLYLLVTYMLCTNACSTDMMPCYDHNILHSKQ